MIIERTTVHVSDDTGRIAMLEKRTEGDAVDDNGTTGLLTWYIYSNHLQSASLELDASGAIISYEEYLDKGEVEAGTQVVEEAKGEGGMYTTTVTYRVVREATEDQPALVRLWGYQENYERYSKPEVRESEPETELPNLVQPEQETPVIGFRDNTSSTVIKPKPNPKPQKKQTVPKVLPPPPTSITLSTSEIVGTAVWRTDMTQQGYEYTLSLVKQLRNTDLGEIHISFGVPGNLGDVVRSGFENVNPTTGRVTSYDPMIMRKFTNSNMQMRNVEAQGRDFQSQLQRRLKVPVYLEYKYKSGTTTIRFTPKRKK